MASKKDNLVERAERILAAAKEHAEKLAAADVGEAVIQRLEKALEALKGAGPAGAASRAPPTVGQQALIRAIGERIGEIQDAIVRVFPHNASIRSDFRVGVEMPADVAGTLEFARAVEPAAREYASNLLSRGVDAGKLMHLRKLIADLDREGAQAPTAGGPSADAGSEVEKLTAQIVGAARRALAAVPEALEAFTGAPKAGGKKKKA